MTLYALTRGYAILEKMTEAYDDPSKLTKRTLWALEYYKVKFV